MAKAEFEHDVICPAITRRTAIAERLESVISGLGQVTIFGEPTNTGASTQTTIGPFDLMEARELSERGRGKFVRGVLEHMEDSPCVVIRQVSPVSADNRKA